jgi:hypothetical protein
MSKEPEKSERELAREQFFRDAPTYEEVMRRKALKAQRRKALMIEVKPRTFEAAKDNPSEVKIITKDRHGNTVTERPHRMSDAEIRARNEAYLASRGRDGLPPEFGKPRDQYWVEQRSRYSDEVRFVRDNGGGLVRHQYDIFEVLREDDR